MSNNKIGFWSVFAIVVGSQVGTGVFITPVSLAPYGIYSIIGWVFASIGALALSLVFSGLCAKFPETGGAHVYVRKAFGPAAGFFVGWTYWVISWVSTTSVVTACIGYLTPIIGLHSKEIYLILEIILLFSISLVNFKGVGMAGKAEFILGILKFVPLIVVPLAALPYFDIDNFVVDSSISCLSADKILGQVTLLTLWGFVGLECTTTAAGSVNDPAKTIPRAIISGTTVVAVIYILNSVSVMGLINGSEMIGSKAPYVTATQKIFGRQMAGAIGLIAAITCIGTLNAWMLVSGQIVLGLAQDGLMPGIFTKRNANGAPIWGIVTSCLGITPLLFLTASESFAAQVTLIIDFSVTAFLFVYLACCLAFFKIMLKNVGTISVLQFVFGTIATIFCTLVIVETSIKTLFIASLFTISGLPVYFIHFRNARKIILN